MIYRILLITYRWFVFATLAIGLLYAGLANAKDFDQIELPFKEYVLAALGILIALHFGLLMYYGGEVREVFLRMYFDNHYTVVRKGHAPVTYKAEHFREIRHEFEDMDDVKIYYNNFEGKPSVTKRIRL